jgi:hypothetical protein
VKTMSKKLLPRKMRCENCGKYMFKHTDTQYGEKFVWFECRHDGWIYSYSIIEQFIHRNKTQKQLDTMNDWVLYILKGITITMGENGFRVKGSDKLLDFNLIKKR